VFLNPSRSPANIYELEKISRYLISFFLLLVALIIFLVIYNIQQSEFRGKPLKKVDHEHALLKEADTNAVVKNSPILIKSYSVINSSLKAVAYKLHSRDPQIVKLAKMIFFF
jgi:hypothetical protein